MSDPREPFYEDENRHREELGRRVSTLSDDELQQVHDLFHSSNHKDIPIHHWMLGPRVRVLIRKEQVRRQSLGEPTA